MQSQTSQQYVVAIRILHWLMACILLSLIAAGWYMSDLPKEDPLRGTFYSLHKSFGVTVLALVIVRLTIRLMTVTPDFPSSLRAWEKMAARVGHCVLYGLMFLIPLVGISMSNGFGHPVSWFGLELPRIIEENRPAAMELATLHGWLAYLLLGVIAVHASAALKHLFLDAINLFHRIW